MPNFELTAEGAKALIEQLPDKELDKLCEMLSEDAEEDEFDKWWNRILDVTNID